MSIKHIIAVAVASVFTVASAQAATVSSTTSVTAEFDVSAFTPGTVGRYNYSCGATCSGGNGSGDPDNLATGASFMVNFGTSAGASDLSSGIFTNNFAFDITNVVTVTGLPVGGLDLPGSLSTIFVTFVYVDDQFDVSSIGIFFGDDRVLGQISELAVGDVPLPAALPLFLAGIAGVGAAARRKRKTA